MTLVCLLMFYTIVFVCFSHVDPNGFRIYYACYFMILLVLIFIVNQNFRLLNWRGTLLLSFGLLPFAFCNFFMLLLFVLLLSINYLLITIVIYSLIYLFIHNYYITYLFCHLDLYKVQPIKVYFPHNIRFTTVYIAYL